MCNRHTARTDASCPGGTSLDTVSIVQLRPACFGDLPESLSMTSLASLPTSSLAVVFASSVVSLASKSKCFLSLARLNVQVDGLAGQYLTRRIHVIVSWHSSELVHSFRTAHVRQGARQGRTKLHTASTRADTDNRIDTRRTTS